MYGEKPRQRKSLHSGTTTTTTTTIKINLIKI